MAADLVFLKDEKLRILAELIYKQEVLNIQSLILGAELKTKFQNDSVRSPIAVTIHAYTESCINNALQIFQNYTVRKDYLEKIHEHVQHLITSLEQLDTQNAADVAALATQVEDCNKAIVTNAVKYRSPASQEFSRLLKAQNITFENLVPDEA
ncbi:hypothetical protein FNV43_RR10131 [Rhamnella rubrinervis]|uniref:Uncharacterized protein n=1 Tax=Rhamnella rubrinervis TaxID=2594499 RepID=A0A8K0HC24_9ROSA|nr:hypothetical protein FNV43_RR10131 [Rhamnella rubrinervis]